MYDADVAATAAQCHYQAGRFHDAAIELEEYQERILRGNERGKLVFFISHPPVIVHDDDKAIVVDDDGIITANDDPPSRTQFPGGIVPSSTSAPHPPKRKRRRRRAELVALPALARRADIAMCHFRSAMTRRTCTIDTTEEITAIAREHERLITSTTSILLRRTALHANAMYRRALFGAATSLGRTVAQRQHARRRRVYEAKETLHRRTTEDEMHLRRTMADTALAILMAGIAASYLHLHCDDVDDDDNKPETAASGGVDSAWTVLVDAITMAADLILTRRRAWLVEDEVDTPHRLEDGVSIGGTSIQSSTLERSLIILNELTSLATHEEGERWNVAMHSFRTALKVAGLATGRLILTKAYTITSRSGERASPFVAKAGGRRKFELKKENGEQSTSTMDAWNVNYVHSNPLLHSRDKLVDALSFHSATVHHPRKRRMLIDSRDACFNEAVAWEDVAGGSIHIDDSVATETTTMSKGRAGYAWTIRTCLHGLEITLEDDSAVDDEHNRTTIGAVVTLASKSMSRFARDLLGCFHARDGDPSLALQALQSSLECGRRREERNRGGSDEETGDDVVDLRTVANMAMCFASMGETSVSLELLLHQWMTLSSESRNTMSNASSRPVALLLSCAMYVCRLRGAKHQLLWKLYQSSSLAQDWSTCLNVTEEMLDLLQDCDDHLDADARCHVDIARVFALLQCRRMSAAEDDTRALLAKLGLSKMKSTIGLSFSRILLCIVVELYHADALLRHDNCAEDFVENEVPWECTQRAIDTLDSVVGKMNNNHYSKAKNNTSLSEIHIISLNDHGIALLIKGDSVGALRCFQKAATLTKSSGRLDESGTDSLSWLIIPTHFNLSLLLLRDGWIDESAKSWLCVRGHFDVWQKAMHGDNEALLRLKNLCIMSVNCHGLLIANEGMTDNAMTLWEQEYGVEWVPPLMEAGIVTEDTTRVGGVDASQITALDVLLSKYALSTAEKKSSLLFRRSAGGIRY